MVCLAGLVESQETEEKSPPFLFAMITLYFSNHNQTMTEQEEVPR